MTSTLPSIDLFLILGENGEKMLQILKRLGEEKGRRDLCFGL